MPHGKPKPQRPRYVLRLDDLPKVVQADGAVYPIYLTLTDCARLFGIQNQTLRQWIERYELPVLRVGKNMTSVYVPVAELETWLARNTTLLSESATFTPDEGASSGTHSSEGRA